MPIERKQDLEFLKWDKVGKAVSVVITDEPVLGRANSFGGEDYFFRGLHAGTEDKVQINMPYDLRSKVGQVLEAGAIAYGETRFDIKFTGTKPMVGKAPLKLFEVEVDDATKARYEAAVADEPGSEG